jgi:electron transport protein HydN
MQKGVSFVIGDPGKCTGCRSCELACFAAHEKSAPKTVGMINSPVVPNLFVTKADGVAILRMPVQCHHCEDAPCLISCIEGAITRNAEGSVVINAKRCIGCRNCALACPFGAVAIVESALKEVIVKASGGGVATARKCDLCEGRTEGPACIAACPNEALRKVDMVDELRNKRTAAVSGLESFVK